MSLFRLAVVLILCAAAAACSSARSSARIDYKKAVTEAPLDLPPAMRAPVAGPDGVEIPATAESSAALLPQVNDVRLVRHGDVRWLVVKGNAEELWPRLHDFWTRQGLEVFKEDARVGIIETQWAENRADIPESFLRGLVSKVAPNVYSAHTRDKYRVRMERGAEPGTTEIYLNHYGVEQVNRGEQVVWQPRPSDPELVAEMLSRLMLFLGVTEERVQTVLAQKGEEAPRSHLEGGQLVVNEGFARAWRLAGLALDRVGLVVEDLDRAKGLYYVRQTDLFVQKEEEKKGWFAGWFGSDKPQERRFRLQVQGDEKASRITALDDRGEPLPPEAAKLVLTRVQEQLR